MYDQTKISQLSVCVVILAYGSRTENLRRVLSAVLDIGVGHIIVVANAVTFETHQMLNNFSKTYPDCIEILTSYENIGSAGGYALGLRAAFKTSYDFFWLLDDDNLPQKNALMGLINAFSFHTEKIKKDGFLLLSFRKSLPEMMYYIHSKSQIIYPRPASFIGFHIFNIWKDFLLFIQTKKKPDTAFTDHHKNNISLNFAPYGGLFFHRDAVKILGLPNPLFFLYSDDLAYTLNFTLKGGSLFLVPDSCINDIEPPWNATTSKTFNISRRLKVMTAEKTYYEVRNRVYLGRTMFPGHPLIYLLNKWLYITILGNFALYYRSWKRFKLILRAVTDGEKGRLGKRIF
ncbi:MAG: glycosyltransferase [Desulfatiglans sp.]|nr:glycosyltransferase [Desulfatiglans sp.]